MLLFQEITDLMDYRDTKVIGLSLI